MRPSHEHDDTKEKINPRGHSSRRKSDKRNKKLPCLSDFNHTFEALQVDEDKQLELVHLVFRQGVRTPSDTYPNDPFVNNTFSPTGWGHVTNNGKCRLYDTGKWLRTRYNTFLGDEYFPDLFQSNISNYHPQRYMRYEDDDNQENICPCRTDNTKLPCLSDFNHTFDALQVDEDKQLELVHLVFRHGIRTPTDTYPNDPYVNNTFSPFGWGHITNNGKCRLYDTGKWIRTRYNTFLGDEYFPDLVHAQSTGVARTHISIATIMASLFKPKGTKMEWNKGLNWQPIQIIAEELDKDTLLLVRINCPRYYEALNEVLQKPEVKKYFEDNQELYEELTKITGMEIKNPEDVSSLYSTLVAEKEFGLVLPEWTSGYFPNKMQDNAEYAFILNLYTDELKRIKGGPFLKKMSDEWVQKSQNKLSPKGRKIYLYAGHDSTVVNILSALNVWTQQFPGYNIMAIFELYKNIKTGEYDIKVYQKNEGQQPIPLTLPGCGISCPLGKVLKIINPMITETLKKSCIPKDPNTKTPKLTRP